MTNKKSRKQVKAALALNSTANSASLAADFSKSQHGELDLTACMKVLEEKVQAIQGGDLAQTEATLVAQAVSLDAIYTTLARRALLSLGGYKEAVDTYLRLALKAQSQCRQTIESLAHLKSPPMVIAKHANITHGNQQINNSLTLNTTDKNKIPPNKLLEQSHEERMDTRTKPQTSPSHQELATMDKIHRRPHG